MIKTLIVLTMLMGMGVANDIDSVQAAMDSAFASPPDSVREQALNENIRDRMCRLVADTVSSFEAIQTLPGLTQEEKTKIEEYYQAGVAPSNGSE